MRNELNLRHVRWIKIVNPTEADVGFINRECNLHPLVLRELLMPTIRPKVDSYPHYVYTVMHVPVFEANDRKTYARELDCVLLADTIITVTYDSVVPLEEFWEIAKKDKSPHLEKEAGHVLYHLLHHLFLFSLRELDHIQENINTLEDIMFYGKNDEIAHDIYIARRDIIDFRRTLKPQEGVFRSLEEQALRIYGEEISPFFRNLTGEYLRIWDILEGHKETIEELYDTNESIIAGKLNKTMKVLTALAFITFIPGLFANVFGMSIKTFPLIDNPNAFWIIMGAALIISIGVYWYFKTRKII